MEARGNVFGFATRTGLCGSGVASIQAGSPYRAKTEEMPPGSWRAPPRPRSKLARGRSASSSADGDLKRNQEARSELFRRAGAAVGASAASFPSCWTGAEGRAFALMRCLPRRAYGPRPVRASLLPLLASVRFGAGDVGGCWRGRPLPANRPWGRIMPGATIVEAVCCVAPSAICLSVPWSPRRRSPPFAGPTARSTQFPRSAVSAAATRRRHAPNIFAARPIPLRPRGPAVFSAPARTGGLCARSFLLSRGSRDR